MKPNQCRKGHLRGLILGIAVIFLLTLGGCGSGLVAEKATSEMDGLTATLVEANSADKGTGETYFNVKVELENNTDEDIARVEYDLVVLDEEGKEVHAFQSAFDGRGNNLAKGDSITLEQDGFHREFSDGEVGTMTIRLTAVTPASEVDDSAIPTEGKYLYEVTGDSHLANIKEELPAKIVVGLYRLDGLEEAVFEDEETVSEAADLFTEITIGKETKFATMDDYDYIVFTWKDGEETYVNLNKQNLEQRVSGNLCYYELENLEGFWDLAEKNAAPVEEE